METVTVAVTPRPYEAVIEDGLLDRAGARLRDLGVARAPSPANRQSQQVFVITVPQVRRRWRGARMKPQCAQSRRYYL